MKSIAGVFLIFLFFIPAMQLCAQSNIPGSEIIGSWNLTFSIDSDDHPGWLHVKRSGSRTMVGSFVGTSGSMRPISQVYYSPDNGIYTFSIPPQWEPTESNLEFTFETLGEKISGSVLMGDREIPFQGKRAPDLIRDTPPTWGNPVNLLDEQMSKWVIPQNNKFSMINGILTNESVGGNLVSKEHFDDFKLYVEFRYPEGSNSGIYLRGRYEVQIEDNYGQDINKEIIGGIYGFIEPSVNAAKKPGEWQTFDITLAGRQVSVVHNGVEVISRRSIPGITGGALDSDEGKPGPIMLQGDHGPVEFRKIILTPGY